MLFFIYFTFIARIAAEIKSNNFKSIPNTKAELAVIFQMDSLSRLQCTIQCTLKEDCNRANWSSRSCQLLRDPTEGEIQFSEDPDYEYICEYDSYCFLF